MDTPARRAPLRRSTRPILGGVCAGLAEWADLDPRAVRLVTAVVGLVTGGAAVAGYLLAWVLIPPAGRAEPEPAEAGQAEAGQAAGEPVVDEPRVTEPVAWEGGGYAVGDTLQPLLGRRRRTSDGDDTGASPWPRSPRAAVDRVATGAGDRLRSPQTRESVRRVAEKVSRTVGDGADELARRARRSG
jgi:phage shock protein PspC (stress-responsive transcriptional regulator)